MSQNFSKSPAQRIGGHHTPDPVTVRPEKEIEPLTVSLATASRLLGISDRHIRSHLDSIPHIRIGGRLLFRVESLRQMLADREKASKC